MIYLQLFFCFFQIGLLSMGGGYVVIPLVQSQVVQARGWLSMAEFTDLVTIAEMTPGPISLNAATFVGTRMAGVGGGIIASLGCIFPSCIIVSIMAYIYFRYKNLWGVNAFLSGVRPAVAAFVASAGVSILLTALFG
ncbi:chromate transporter, partial [Ruminococcaceae bacterium OttesenSCG-928-N02]|nr:chromate transporter [Ruminococcaceae bacterium OttesenSCG-928-N02]